MNELTDKERVLEYLCGRTGSQLEAIRAFERIESAHAREIERLRAAFERAVNAWGDLSIECSGVWATHAPSTECYNKSFAELTKARAYIAALAANGSGEIMDWDESATECKPIAPEPKVKKS